MSAPQLGKNAGNAGFNSWFDMVEDETKDPKQVSETQTDIPEARPEPDGPLVKQLFERNITEQDVLNAYNEVKDTMATFEFGGEVIARPDHIRSGAISRCDKLIQEIAETTPSEEFKHVAIVVTDGNGVFFMDADTNPIDDEIKVEDLTWEDWMGMHIHPASLEFLEESKIAYTLLVHMTSQGDSKDEVNGRVAYKVLMDSIHSIEEH